MRVSLVIPAWNLLELTAACLRSLASHSRGADLEVLLGDNGSTDATPAALPILGRGFLGNAFACCAMKKTWVTPRPAMPERARPAATCCSFSTTTPC